MFQRLNFSLETRPSEMGLTRAEFSGAKGLLSVESEARL